MAPWTLGEHSGPSNPDTAGGVDDRRLVDDVPTRDRLPDYLGPPAQLELTDRLVNGHPGSDAEREATRRFLVHVLESQARRRFRRHDDGPDYEREVVRVPSTFIKAHFRGANWEWLRDERVFSDVRRYEVGRRARGFTVERRALAQYLEAGRVRVDDRPTRRVDLLTGKPTTRQVRSDKNDANRNPYPPLVRGAIDAVGPAVFDAAAVERHLARLDDEVGAARGGDAAVRRRLENDERCYKALYEQNSEVLGGGLVEYRPAYAVQRTGRLGQKGGGLQSASRAMKAAAYGGLPDVRNYDLRSSQAHILVALMREAGIEPRWLARYGAAWDAKRRAAEVVGVSVDAWKASLYAVLMSAWVPTPNQLAFSREGAVRRTIERDVGPDGLDVAYRRFHGLIGGLVSELAAWHDHIVGPYVDAHGRFNPKTRSTYVENAVGMTMAVRGPGAPASPHELRARTAAFFLQGREAALVHRIAAEAGADFRVYSHEHDGLVVEGRVPPSVVARAARGADLPGDLVQWEEKPLA